MVGTRSWQGSHNLLAGRLQTKPSSLWRLTAAPSRGAGIREKTQRRPPAPQPPFALGARGQARVPPGSGVSSALPNKSVLVIQQLSGSRAHRCGGSAGQ